MGMRTFVRRVEAVILQHLDPGAGAPIAEDDDAAPLELVDHEGPPLVPHPGQPRGPAVGIARVLGLKTLNPNLKRRRRAH